MFYNFRQNNSGGFLSGPQFVIIEADSAEEANKIAEENDIYFDGVSKGFDCECCGDRWRRVYTDDGDAEPLIYGKPAEEYNDFFTDSVPGLKIIRRQ